MDAQVGFLACPDVRDTSSCELSEVGLGTKLPGPLQEQKSALNP